MANGRLPASLWAPGTKITRPAPRPEAVIDPQLADRLERAATSLPFTLVSAQAGSGKTTLVAAVAERLAHRGTAVAWLGLDAGDDDPAIFLELLAVVLGEAMPGGCAVTADLLAGGLTGPLAEPRRGAGVLLNDLSMAGDVVVLVLDDLHLLGTGPALDTLGELVTHAPANLHVVATTRTDPALPLARLRSQGLLGEVRASDLRFGAAQAAVLLNDHLGLDLSTPEVEGIVAAAGGWVTGVRVLARSAHTTPSAGAAAHAEDVYEYLAAEVLDAEPDDRRRFLLDTAVLDELTRRRARR